MDVGYQLDNSGNKVCDPGCVDPVEASGITLTITAWGNDYTQTLAQGQLYAVTPIGVNVLASATGVTSTAANIEWVFPSGVTTIFRMPIDKTTLYFEGDVNTKYAYVRKLA